MKQVQAKSITKEEIVYFGDFLHIEKPKSDGLQNFRNVVRMIKSQQVDSRKIVKRLAVALIRLRIYAGWSELLFVARTTLFDVCFALHAGKFHMPFKQNGRFQNKNLSGYHQSVK